MIALTSHELASVAGGAEQGVDSVQRAAQWWNNVFDKGFATANDLGSKGAQYGAIIGFGAAAAGGVTLPAAGLAALAGSGKGWVLGYGTGFVYGAGREVYRNWNDRPWK